MNEIPTTVVMVSIFCIIGVVLPMLPMVRDENKNPQSALPNKLILWITMVFCMILVFGIVVNFQGLPETIRGDIIQYGFITLMLFGTIFGIDQLLKSKYIKTVKWKDLTVETNRATTDGQKDAKDGSAKSDNVESESDNRNVAGDSEHENS
jgi:hypothetical protein